MTKKRTKDLIDSDRRHLWHPFTQMKEWTEDEILVIDRGEGNYLVDTEGRRYLDGVSSLWCNVHGHRRKEIDAAVRKQLGRMAHSTMLGLTHEPGIRLAEKLVSVVPEGLTRVFYSDNGSTAMEVALKMAFQYWAQTGKPGKRSFVTLSEGYHGDTVGSVSLGSVDLFHAKFGPLLFRTFRAPTTYAYRCAKAEGDLEACGRHCLEDLEAVLREHADEVAAVAMEPLVQGAGGIIVQPQGFVSGVRELCDKYGVLLICDEVATGFGRTGGRLFACQHEGITPDIMAVAKGITGGYLPLAATLATERIYEAFLGAPEEKKTFFHGHTYTGNPLGCAAALACLRIFEEEKTLERLRPVVHRLANELSIFYELPGVGDVRACGLMAGIELVEDTETKKPYPAERRTGHRVILEARRRGAILRPLGDVVVLMPPLSITGKEMLGLLDVAAESIRAVCGP
ncbi:MAG: adenosylmethionine--8-amino-7-oxononanoate transaminase [Planctomycetota bacterium]